MDVTQFLFDHLRRDSAPGCDKPDLAAAVRADRVFRKFSLSAAPTMVF